MEVFVNLLGAGKLQEAVKVGTLGPSMSSKGKKKVSRSLEGGNRNSWEFVEKDVNVVERISNVRGC